MPALAAQYRYSEFYTGNKEYAATRSDDLKKLIRTIGKDRFTWKELEGTREIAFEMFGKDSDPFSILWQNGMVGYLSDDNEDEKYVFYSEDMMVDFKLPKQKTQYVFHPCLVDAVGLKGMGKEPITPCR